jgi:hypothetical protein
MDWQNSDFKFNGSLHSAMKQSIELILRWIQEPIGIFHDLTEIYPNSHNIKKALEEN